MLACNTVSWDEIVTALHHAGVKPPAKLLQHFLTQQGVTYTPPRPSKRRRRNTKKKQVRASVDAGKDTAGS
eukprot:CAMPEP_0196736146 /NCGR_PEP_ID=MMETSP1091-20130531/14306_1 /TAXON_ID=302021 /ORGANISM="Rhodomonas sp., Strain CCMP768" /LENGTH=70 /DNA_ID=CAMNT_0042079843 /DNA_START=93 /DNA_END=305 /DNA_ORIENTATION=+